MKLRYRFAGHHGIDLPFQRKELLMKKRVRLVQYGLGTMGSLMVRLVANKSGLEYVAGGSASRRYSGFDLGEASGLGKRLGVMVKSSVEETLKGISADVMLHATVSEMKELMREVLPALRAGLNVISLAEELSYPWERNPKLARELDETAKEHGVTVLGTGINPGFMMDLLPLSFTGICGSVRTIRVRRVVDFSVYGQSVMEHIGANLTPEEFDVGLRNGSIVLHVGLPESIQMVAKGLGWRIEELKEHREALVSRTDRLAERIEVKAGRVCGFRQTGEGRGQGNKIELEVFGIILPDPSEDRVSPGTWIDIEGDPGINVAITGSVSFEGGLTTVAHAVNSVPMVVEARPGLLTTRELPAASCLPDKNER